MTQADETTGGRPFNSDRAAMILVDAAFSNDIRAAKKHGVADRTIRGWRERMETDEILASKFRIAYEQATNKWADRLNGAIISGIEFLQNAAMDADHKDAGMVAALGEAWGKLVEARMTVDLLNGRLANQNKPVRSEDDTLAGQTGSGDSSING